MKKDDRGVIQRYVRQAEPDDDLRRLLIRHALRHQRAKINFANSLGPRAGTAEKLSRKRFAQAQSQKLRRKLLGSSRPPISKDILVHRYSPHPVLEALQHGRSKAWRPILARRRDRGRVTVSVPRFSFIDDPVGALRAIAGIAAAECTSLNVSIDFDFSYVEDIGPFLLLAEVWPYLAPVFTGGGKMTPAVQKVIEAVGLRGPLGMAFPGLHDTDDVWAMPVQRRRPSGRSRSQARYLEPQSHEQVALRVCDEIDRWLIASGAEAMLNDRGRLHLSSIVGEILDNAERHSSILDKDGSWTVAAFMARRELGGEERYACHIAFLSLGDTIASSLQATAPAEMRMKIDGFVEDLHEARAPQARDTLVTLAALQDFVTRDADAIDRSSGGTGFMEFVDSVNVLALSNRQELRPQIAILSGSSCVTLRAPYIKGERKPDGKGGRRIFFNAANAADEPPDPAFVQDLPLTLPGTVISVAFTLDPEFYRTTLNGRDQAEGTDPESGTEP